MTYVPQTPMLIQGTIEENIRFYRELDQREIRRAAERAGLHDEISRMPDGYGTVVSNTGTGLSGGQRQRLCLARALAGNSCLLILDEPTASLDELAARRVLDVLRSLSGKISILLVTHDPDAMQVCDRVVVVDGGRCIAMDGAESVGSVDRAGHPSRQRYVRER
jgi:ABC-type multidrug transport system fused ATPase/permease subunit